MTRKQRRLSLVLACGVGLGGATVLTLKAFSSNIVYFMLPGQVLSHLPVPGQTFRLGGMVAEGSLHQTQVDGSPGVVFGVTDEHGHVVEAEYQGVLPDLFREGQGVVTVGSMTPSGEFLASDVLAKHDADYMPPDVEKALKKAGMWDPASGQPVPAAAWNGQGAKLAQD